MKKLLLAFLAAMLVFSCSEDDSSNGGDGQDKKVYLVNSLGEVGTLSVISNGEISNDVLPLGKFPNDIKVVGNKIVVVNSGNNNLQLINKDSLTNIDAMTMATSCMPMFVDFVGSKGYVTATNYSKVQIRDLDNSSYHDEIDIYAHNNGSDAICTFDGSVFVNRNNYTVDPNWNFTYEPEYVLKINSSTKQIVDSVLTGVNVSDLLVDKQGDLHVLCKGDYASVEGVVYKVDGESFDIVDSLALGSSPGAMAYDKKANQVFVSISGMNPDFSGFGKVISYDANSLEIIQGEDDPVYDSPDSGIMDIIYFEGKIMFPLFSQNKLIVLDIRNTEADVIEYETGNGPQTLAY